MPVTVICVGRLRERFFADAAAEYLKRLRRLMPVTVIEVPDEPEPAQPGDAQNEVVLRREGERIPCAPDGPGSCHRPVRGRKAI